MATLAGATAELVSVISGVSGVKYAPSEPSEQIKSWPVAMTYTTDGRVSELRASIENKSLHTINIAVLMPLNDLRQAVLTMLPLYEPITDALINHLNGRTSTQYATWRNLAYTLGPVEWPTGDVMYGYVFTLQEVKIQNDLS